MGKHYEDDNYDFATYEEFLEDAYRRRAEKRMMDRPGPPIPQVEPTKRRTKSGVRGRSRRKWIQELMEEPCTYCGRSETERGVKMTIEHIIPLSLGGTNRRENLIPACERCNNLRGNGSIKDLLDLLQAERNKGLLTTAPDWPGPEAILRGAGLL